MEGDEDNSESEYDDEAPPDEGQRLSCIIHRICHTPQQEMLSQSNNLFRTRGTIHGKVCDIIIDNGSTDNLISWKAVRKLGLEVKEHKKPYSVSWIHSGNSVTVDKSCKVHLSIGRKYKDEISCDVVNMDAAHVLLGRPWQFDVSAHYNGRTNQYIVKVGDLK